MTCQISIYEFCYRDSVNLHKLNTTHRRIFFRQKCLIILNQFFFFFDNLFKWNWRKGKKIEKLLYIISTSFDSLISHIEWCNFFSHNTSRRSNFFLSNKGLWLLGEWEKVSGVRGGRVSINDGMKIVVTETWNIFIWVCHTWEHDETQT